VQDGKTLLSQGIKILCQNDEEIDRLIAPRSEKIISLLDLYINEIKLFNSAYGLVGTSDTREIIIRHILDSIAPLGKISCLLSETNLLQIADVGSGAGLPGIPLAITMPKYSFTLIERMGRRAGFLCSTKAILASRYGLNNITVEESDLEKTQNGRFSLITFRAFKGMDAKLLKTLFNACIPPASGKSIIAAYKGKLEKIKQEMASIGDFSVKWEAISYSVPFLDEERHLLVISK